ncbi:MAG: hypothetical protein QM765_09400 [Myxococcales bacterium]
MESEVNAADSCVYHSSSPLEVATGTWKAERCFAGEKILNLAGESHGGVASLWHHRTRACGTASGAKAAPLTDAIATEGSKGIAELAEGWRPAGAAVVLALEL